MKCESKSKKNDKAKEQKETNYASMSTISYQTENDDSL